MPTTDYLVFQEVDRATVEWKAVKVYTAASADSAKSQAALDCGDGTYSAVPARSWQPSTFTVQPRAVQVKT